ncbi:MAG: hypothetical protein ACT4TC_04310 [Myxococcaceae bacterium]
MRRAPPAVFAVLIACATPGIPRNTEDDLEGLRASLKEGPIRAVLDGSARGKPAEVELELASPLSRISAGCFDGDIPSPGSVDLAKWSGGYERLPEIRVRDAKVGDRLLHERAMALTPRTDACVLQLGADVLANYALEIDPEKRELRLSKSTVEPPEDEWKQAQDLDLARDPRTDWPVIAAQLYQGDKVITAPFIFSTVQTTTRVGQPFTSGELDALELSPKVAVTRLTATLESDWKQPVAQGVLGSDVWGWFKVRIDPHAGRLHVALRAGQVMPVLDKTAPGKLLPDEPEPDDPQGALP